jgi:hypothetical protein
MTPHTTRAGTPSRSRIDSISACITQWCPGPCAMIATRQAVATTLGRISVSSTVARSVCSFIARSSSGVTRCIRTRALWNVNLSSGRTRSRLRSSWGTSVSIVVLELGTIRPTRCNDFIVGQHPTRRRSQPRRDRRASRSSPWALPLCRPAGALKPDLTSELATGIFWTVASPETYDALVMRPGWTPRSRRLASASRDARRLSQVARSDRHEA